LSEACPFDGVISDTQSLSADAVHATFDVTSTDTFPPAAGTSTAGLLTLRLAMTSSLGVHAKAAAIASKPEIIDLFIHKIFISQR
jgi:hypothetical protein